MEHPLPLLQDLLVLLLASVPIAFIFNRLRLPTIVGFMITGVLIGPYALGLIHDVAAIEVLAEIGVVLLLFTIGLEFSLRRIAEMKRLVFLGGGLQVILTVLIAAAITNFLGRPAGQAVFFGFLFALSSTAIVLKSYIDRAEVDAPHGRAAVGIATLPGSKHCADDALGSYSRWRKRNNSRENRADTRPRVRGNCHHHLCSAESRSLFTFPYRTAEESRSLHHFHSALESWHLLDNCTVRTVARAGRIHSRYGAVRVGI